MNEILALPIIVETPAFALWVAVSGACVCAMVLASAAILGRRSAPLGYGILMAGVVGLLAVPALVGVSRSLPATYPSAPPDEEVVRIPVERLPELLGRGSVDLPLTDTDAPSSQILAVALVAVWILGMAVGLGRLLCALWKRNRVIISQPWQPGFWTVELQERLARKLGLARFPDVFHSPVVPMPMVVGTWRPAIVLPEQAPASWRQPQWEAVLLHEAAHIARRDPWAVLAQAGAAILFWWFPLVYLLSRRLNLLRESICDDYALQGPCDHIAYAELLIESAERLLSLKTVPAPLALLNSARGGLEARVTRLLEKERSTMTKLSLPGKLGAGFLVAACLVATAATAFSAGQPQAQKKVQIKIIVDGKEFDLGDVLLGDHVDATPKKEAVAAEKHKTWRAISAPVAVEIDDGEKTLANPAERQRPREFYFSIDDKKTSVKTAPGDVIVRPMYTLNTDTQVDPAQAKPDSRIEELVKQAEAIKPGSGAAIRNALQGGPTGDDKKDQSGQLRVLERLLATQRHGKLVLDELATPEGKKIFVLTTDGKKVIELTLDDKLLWPDLTKALREYARFGVHTETKLPASPETKKEKADMVVAPQVTFKLKAHDPKVAPPATTDMEALRRQLERLSAEVQALKQRLDANKK